MADFDIRKPSPVMLERRRNIVKRAFNRIDELTKPQKEKKKNQGQENQPAETANASVPD